jgi:ankyrin repeat protein
MSAILWAEIYHFPGKYPAQDRANSTEVFDILLAHNADVNYNGTHGGVEGMTPLGCAANLFNYPLSLELTEKLLKAGADPNPDRVPENLSPLYWALTNVFTRWEENGHENRAELIKMLLDAGADPNALCDGYAPLHLTAIYDDDLTKMLLAAGADKQIKSIEGLTPLDYAFRYRNFKTIKLLLGN